MIFLKKEIVLKEEKFPENKPSIFVSLIPIILPIVMIIINTVANSVMGEAEPEIFKFIGDKTTALLTGAIAAYIIAVKSMGREKAEKAATDSLSSAGIVFLITGAGGAFSNIITITGVSGAISEIVSGLTTNVFVVIILCISCRFTDQTGNRFRNSICNHKYDNYVKCRSGSCTSTSIYCNGMFVWYIIWCDS